MWVQHLPVYRKYHMYAPHPIFRAFAVGCISNGGFLFRASINHMMVAEDLAKKIVMPVIDQTKNFRSKKLEGKNISKRQIYKNQNIKTGYVLHCILSNYKKLE